MYNCLNKTWLCRNMENYPFIILIAPSYLNLCHKIIPLPIVRVILLPPVNDDNDVTTPYLFISQVNSSASTFGIRDWRSTSGFFSICLFKNLTPDPFDTWKQNKKSVTNEDRFYTIICNSKWGKHDSKIPLLRSFLASPKVVFIWGTLV